MVRVAGLLSHIDYQRLRSCIGSIGRTGRRGTRLKVCRSIERRLSGGNGPQNKYRCISLPLAYSQFVLYRVRIGRVQHGLCCVGVYRKAILRQSHLGAALIGKSGCYRHRIAYFDCGGRGRQCQGGDGGLTLVALASLQNRQKYLGCLPWSRSATPSRHRHIDLRRNLRRRNLRRRSLWSGCGVSRRRGAACQNQDRNSQTY